MINSTENIEIVNAFLKHFDTTIDKISVFSKYLVYRENMNIGFLAYQQIYDRIEIDYIFVDESYRKKGIATKLLTELIEIVKESSINITLEVAETNEAAISFYEKNGFIRAAIRDSYYGDKNGILMIREMR